MKTFLRYSIGFLSLYVGVFSFSSIAFASTYSQQVVSSNSTDGITSTQFAIQKLGTGLTGTLNQYSVYLDNTTNTAGTFRVLVYTDGVAGTCGAVTNQLYSATFSLSNGQVQYFSPSSVGVSFDPTLVHCIGIVASSSYPGVKVRGDSSNSFTSNNAFYAGAQVMTPVKNMGFIFDGVQTVQNTSYVFNLKPGQGSTTPSTSVTLSMSYHASVEQSINSYNFLVNDISSNPYGFATSTFSIGGIASTGDGTVSRVVTLVSGHLYSVQGQICNASGSCYSGVSANQFSVVTNFNTVYDSYFTASGGMVATSSSDFYNASSIFPSIARKVPFAWFYQIYTTWNNTISTSTDNLVGLTLSLHDLGLGSTTSMGNILPNWVALSKDTVLTYMSQSQLDVFKTMMSIVLYAGLLLYIFRRTSNFIST